MSPASSGTCATRSRDGDHLLVATTRPETILGDTALAVNPDDDRYRHLVGREAVVPVIGRLIPIIADDYVDPDFGSGVGQGDAGSRSQ